VLVAINVKMSTKEEWVDKDKLSKMIEKYEEWSSHLPQWWKAAFGELIEQKNWKELNNRSLKKL
jgi:hypothetical protein